MSRPSFRPFVPTGGKKGMTELVVFIDAHTHHTTVRELRRCSACKRLRRPEKFYTRASKCQRCYDQYYETRKEQALDVPLQIERAVYRANNRSRYRRSSGPDLTVEEARRLWTGTCGNCDTSLTFEFHPRAENRNLAIIDRKETGDNAGYSGNMQWLCKTCNTEKGPWDLVSQLNRDLARTRKALRRAKKKRKKKKMTTMYADILMPPGPDK